MNAEQTILPQASDYPIYVISNADDPLAYLARLLLKRHVQQLPDLSRVVILTPNLVIARHLRQLLSQAAREQGINALLSPTISTLRAWVEDSTPLNIPVMSPKARELMLIESLYQHSALFGEGNPWYLASSLIDLFDELTLRNVELPHSLDDFISRLESGYGLKSDNASAFTREAILIHTLWHAWHKQQLEEGMIDNHAAYLAKLVANKHSPVPENTFYLLGYQTLIPGEVEWIQGLIDKKQMTVIVQGNHNDLSMKDNNPSVPAIQKQLMSYNNPIQVLNSCPDSYVEFLDAVYPPGILKGKPDISSHLSLRAQQFAMACPTSPLNERLYMFDAFDAEQEAHAIDIQIRRWLLEGKNRIGIITQDRRLARRLRALLERANIRLQDPAGWALSTTSAASTLEHWLETLEEDFDHQPLLDFLKSPYILPYEALDSRLESVYRLEQDIILHENIARGLDRYRRHIIYRRNRLSWSTSDSDRVTTLLDTLEFAAAPLRPFIRADKFAPLRILDALTESLLRLGIIETFAADEAGERILHEIQLMRLSLKNRTIKTTWNDFRIWLGRTLERSNFSPQQRTSKVLLLNLDQSNLQRFDAVIIASAIDQHLPGPKKYNPFFNDAVRHELGLSDAHESINREFSHFRRLLECAPVTLISYHRTQNGEPLIPSPWVAILRAFHEIAYQRTPHDNHLGDLVKQPAASICNTDPQNLPRRKNYPAPAAMADLIPHTFTATMYQQLINCPYQFYAAHCLGLKPPKAIREAMEKSDYGERIHRVLQLFHGASPPGFGQSITTHTRPAAIKELTDISFKEFARDLEDNVVHRGWLKRWLAAVPSYIDWQIERENEWQPATVETTIVNDKFANNLAIKGRLDRIDKNHNALAIIDYKTGTIPTPDETESGEAVQLPFYAMLTTPVERVEYLQIEKDRVKTAGCLEGSSLYNLTEKTADRLKDMFNEIANGKLLPAWGDENTCSLCSVQTICRKQSWN